MKIDNARRFTSVHQSLTFSRRMMIVSPKTSSRSSLRIVGVGEFGSDMHRSNDSCAGLC